MRSRTRNRNSEDESVIGWISYTDSWMLALIFVLALVVFINASWQQTRADVVRLTNENHDLRPLNDTRRIKESEYQQLLKVQRELADLKPLYEQTVQQLADAREKVDEKIAKIKELVGAIAKLDGQIATLEKEKADITAERDGLAKQLKDARVEIAILEASEKMLLASEKELLASEKKLLAQVTALKALVKEWETYVKKIKDAYDGLPVVHQELLGLKGDLGHVAILFDTSKSMDVTLNGKSRWEAAREVVDSWLQHLGVEHCVLILFSKDARVAYPTEGTWHKIETPKDRELLVDQLRNLEPLGGTNTYEALKLAYSYEDLDTIILYTDGEPNDGNSSGFDEGEAAKIYALCSEQHKARGSLGKKPVPVNTVGLGNYFREELSGFLTKVSAMTGGEFLGR